MGKKLRQKAAKYTPPRNKNAFAFRDDSSTNNNHTGSNTPKPYFSLRDELQSTEKHEWTKESRLRDHKVSFVSAGSMAPLDEPVKLDKPILKKSQANVDQDRDLRNSEDAMAQMDINAQPPAAIPSLDGAEEIEMDIDETVHLHAQITIPIEESTPQQTSVPSPPLEAAPMFFVDTAGDESLAFKGPKSVPAPRARAPSPARSSSSDEVVFRGRNGVTIRDDPPAVISKPVSKPAPKPAPKSSSKPATQPAQVNPQMEKFLKSLDNPPEWAKEMSEQSKARNPSTHPGEQWPSMEQANGFADRLDQDLSGVHASRKSKKNRKKQNRIFRLEQDLEDELLRDYIENIAAEDMPTRRGLGGDDSGDDTDDFFDGLLNEEEKDPDDVDVTALEDEWEDESDSEEDEEDDEDDDDDDTGSEDSSELEERLAREEREQWEDDADIRERRAQAMTDEELALLFMKQEELGIDGDDIMLYDDRFGDVDGARAGLANYSVKTPKGGKKKKGGRKSDNFPDATLMADVLEQDAYGGFDVMDYDRPSLRKKNKGRKSGPLPEELGLSDSDLVEELQNQWANDRSKKASKKAEREELRQLGLLGKKNKFKPDMNQRYTEGITMGQVRIELQDFLEQEDFTTKAFPPMQKNDRKVLHEIANHFNLKSKSVGSGKNRAPVLIKTQRTVEWSEQHFTRVSSLVSRSYLKNSSKKPKSTLAGDVRRTRQMGGGGGGAAAYRNGDVVGHNASEIPATNFGRKLMEKMGWAAGMSLGKEGSGGLLVPVQATVKSGKAGLG
ncbi:hypothetical protein D6C89_09404 [Aureobasidium pullulans]|uniref:Protein SQS1 n=1 Tax=Aureobasidium pullulans TaxID=5580 RepID=A0A4S9SZ55_AURPU|nr:hypothetical protein D6D24_07095 [Aureobasidium pullulans]THZ02235.1 hypothetical protein D6C93_03289 [Aureobasidium pullulans]THZ16135.1 hypothetical protein D6C89_09404 [Aureobasidium pullulans]TIA10502.1 hypothetical protein D6C81_08279 [Aureobasidium pullulans]